MKRNKAEFIAQRVLDENGRVIGLDRIAPLIRCQHCKNWKPSVNGDRGTCFYRHEKRMPLQYCSEAEPRG